MVCMYVCYYIFVCSIFCVVDIPNCAIDDHNCSQICVEVEGSFNCACYPGYELQEDRVNCTGTYDM